MIKKRYGVRLLAEKFLKLPPVIKKEPKIDFEESIMSCKGCGDVFKLKNCRKVYEGAKLSYMCPTCGDEIFWLGAQTHKD